MYASQIAQFSKMLKNLDGCLAKAAAHADNKKYDVNVLTQFRLAPDMFDFTKQIQSACDSAKFCAAYLTGQTAPKHEDNEKTWKELRERISKCVKYLDGFKEKDFAGAATAKCAPKWAEGKWLPGDEYIRELSIPNFYFHVNMAYALLRHAGVDIGKMDYVGQVNFKK